jgi:hypothetical protein
MWCIYSVASAHPFRRRGRTPSGSGLCGAECLDHILPLSERHVRSVLAEFVAHYSRIDPIDCSDWRPQCAPGPSSGACTASTNEAPDPNSTFAALQRPGQTPKGITLPVL